MSEKPIVQGLSEDLRELPTAAHRARYERWCLINEDKAQEYWEQWAREPKIVQPKTEKQVKRELGEYVVARIEHRRVVNEVNARPLRRLKPKESVLRRLLAE